MSDLFVSVTCRGEVCHCGQPAVRKVGEEIPSDDPNPYRHNLTAYICALHYAELMGPLGAQHVGLTALPAPAPAPQGIGRAAYRRALQNLDLDYDPGEPEGDGYRLIGPAIDAILALLPTEPPAQWQPIETAPRDGREILIAWAGSDVMVGWWERSRGYFSWHEASQPRGMQPTHWQPLPEPPAQGEG